MTMQRWEPMKEMMSLRNAVDRLFEDSFVLPPGAWFSNGGNLMPLDISQTDNEVVVKAVMPGFKPDEVDIQITGDTLSIKGEHKEEKEEKNAQYLRKEIGYENFARAITLPIEIKSDQAEATFENGILTLTLPKAEEVKPKQIKVKAKAMLSGEKK